MIKEELLLKMMEAVGRGRRDDQKKKHKHHKESQENHRGQMKKHHKLSPVAENALYILYREGNMNQRTLASRLHVTGQAVSELMKKFEEKGFVLRQAGELNNENRVSLTERGEEKGKECVEKWSKRADFLFRNFNEDDLDSLSTLLDKMEFQEETT